MSSLVCDNNKKRPSEEELRRDHEKRYKPTCRENINALFSSGNIPKGEIHYFFNPFFDDTNTNDGTNESEYWGIRGIKNAYNSLVSGGVDINKIHLPFFASKDTYTAYTEKKKEDNPSKLPINIDNDIFESDEDDGLLNMDNTNGTAFPIDYRDWNMIINLLKYDGKPEGTNGESGEDAEEKFFGPFQYACGDTLPGGYFDADSMRKEVTFVGLYFNTNDNNLTEEQKKKINDLNWADVEDLTRFDRYIEGKKLKQDNAQTSVLRGFIVVKDLHNKEIFEEEGKVKKKEPYLYVEGLCSNARGVGKLLLNDVIEAGRKGQYQGTKLAALTVVISYYYKLGFRFYDENGNEMGDKSPQINNYLDQFIEKNKTDYPSIAHFKNVQKAFDKDDDGNDIFTIEDYHYPKMKELLSLREINAGASWGRRGKPRIANKHTILVDKDGNKIEEGKEGMAFKAYDDEAMGDMGYYMYLKKSSGKGGGKNSKKRTKKKARRRKRKRTKRKRRRKKKRTKKRKRRRTKKRR